MNKLKKAMATLGVAGALVVGGGAFSVATAAPAEAATYSASTYHLYGNTCVTKVRVDYNWWEETFQGKRDYTYVSSYSYCPNPWNYRPA